jgi:hypothetical protein
MGDRLPLRTGATVRKEDVLVKGALTNGWSRTIISRLSGARMFRHHGGCNRARTTDVARNQVKPDRFHPGTHNTRMGSIVLANGGRGSSAAFRCCAAAVDIAGG